MVTAISRWLRLWLGHCRMRLTNSAGSARWGQEFKHTLAVLGEHFGQLARHRISPEKIMI